MPRGKRVSEDFRLMVLMVLHERKIALPYIRLMWYAKWLGIPISFKYGYRVLKNMELEGEVEAIKEGRATYYRINR